ncbi:histone deacetylase 5 [Fagus crenata]
MPLTTGDPSFQRLTFGMPLLDQICGNQDSCVILKLDRLEQFNDVLLQENDSSYNMTSPLFVLDDLISFTSKESNSLEVPMRVRTFYLVIIINSICKPYYLKTALILCKRGVGIVMFLEDFKQGICCSIFGQAQF